MINNYNIEASSPSSEASESSGVVSAVVERDYVSIPICTLSDTFYGIGLALFFFGGIVI